MLGGSFLGSLVVFCLCMVSENQASKVMKVYSWNDLKLAMDNAGLGSVVFELQVDNFSNTYGHMKESCYNCGQIIVDGPGKNYTVEGNGVVLDAKLRGRFFHVQHSAMLTLNNLVLENGMLWCNTTARSIFPNDNCYYSVPEVSKSECYAGKCLNFGGSIAVRTYATVTTNNCTFSFTLPCFTTVSGQYISPNGGAAAIYAYGLFGYTTVNIRGCSFLNIKENMKYVKASSRTPEGFQIAS